MARRYLLIYLSPLLVAVLGIAIIREVRSRHVPLVTSGAPGEDLFREVMDLLRSRYVSDIDADAVALAAAKGMAESLDPYTRVFDRKEWTGLTEDTEGQFTGVGIRWLRILGIPTVVSAVPKGPAERAGVRSGDRIVEVDGVRVPDKATVDETAAILGRLKGPRGSTVVVTVRRPGQEGLLPFAIQRDTIDQASVTHRVLEGSGSVGYIRISDFHRNTAQEFETALRDLKNHGSSALVLDLRLNRGGVLKAAIEIADAFLSSGPIVVTVWRDRSYVNEADDKSLAGDMPVVVLLNGFTASAAEVLAGALQDRGRAVVVGERSFGKGVVQDLVDLETRPGLGVKITTAHYLTPSRRCVEKSVGLAAGRKSRGGILPDFPVKADMDQLQISFQREDYPPELRKLIDQDPDHTKLPEGFRDEQLLFAAELLRGGPPRIITAE